MARGAHALSAARLARPALTGHAGQRSDVRFTTLLHHLGRVRGHGRSKGQVSCVSGPFEGSRTTAESGTPVLQVGPHNDETGE